DIVILKCYRLQMAKDNLFIKKRRDKMKKLLVTGVLASTALFLLGGCGSSSAKSNAASSSEKTSDGKKTIDFWSFWGSGARKEVIEEIIDDYNQSQDKIQ